MKTALLLVDIQNDYFPGGRNELWRPEAAASRAAAALRLFRERSLPVIHVKHVNTRAGATFFLPDTDGANIHASVAPQPGEPVVVKHRPDSFLETDLRERLNALDIERLAVCGMMSHMCIDTTVRSANAKGYGVILLHDACTTRDLEWEGTAIPAATAHSAFMAALRGAFANVISAEDLANALDGGV